MSSTVNVEALAKSTLGLEDSSKSAPRHYVQALTTLLKTNPMDQHFIMELGEEGKSCGGNGYGSVTCMEDYCWEDIILDPQTSQSLDLQKRQGLGSFFNFRVHCQKATHIKGRNERCQKEGITIQHTTDPFASTSTSPNVPIVNRPASQSSQAGPSSSGAVPARYTTSGSGRNLVSLLDDIDHPAPALRSAPAPRQPAASSTGQSTSSSRFKVDPSSSRGLQPHKAGRTSHSASSRPIPASNHHALDSLNVNAPTIRRSSMTQDTKPKLHSAPIRSHSFLISDDEDDIQELIGTRVPPGMRKGREPPVIVRDIPPSMSRQPGSNNSTSSSTSSVQEVKPSMIDLAQRSSRTAVPTLGSSVMTKTDVKPKLTPSWDRAVQSASSSSKPEPSSTLDCCQPSQAEVYERYSKELHLLREALLTLTTRPRIGGHELLRVGDRLTFVTTTMHALKSQPGVTTPWTAPSREVLQTIPSLNSFIGLWRQTDLIKSRQHYLHAGVTRPSSSMSSRPPNAIAGPSSAALSYAADPLRLEMPYTALAHDMLPTMPGAFPSNPLDYPMPSYPGFPLPGLPGATIPMPGMDYEDMYGREWDRPDNLQEFFAGAMNSFEEDQDVDGALKYLKIDDLQQKFRDLAITLMPHQVLSVKFMIEQEKNNRMKGGILADSMGLGKTVSTIATIAGNPSEDRKVKTTLVVAPLALLQQWKSEIETKTTTGRKVLIHWGPKRTTSAAQLKQYDVVLTTYGILTTEHGKPVKPKKGKKKQPQQREQDDELEESDEETPVIAKQGPLFKSMWYRVVLDEAHIIRNRLTRASQAACDLNTHLRWCLTGTPVVNSLCDLYPLLHFLRISPQRDWKEFNAHIGRIEKRKPNLATKRAQAILKTCSMRRNKESTLNGVRLLNLPAKTVTWDELVLSPEERHIYDSIEKRMQIKFNSLLKRGTVLKHYSMVLVMLIRLKQATAHPFLLTRRPEDALHPDDVVISDEELMGTRDAALVDDMKELQRALDSLGQEYVDKVSQKLEERWQLVAAKAQEVKNDKDAVDDTECAICFEPFEHEHAERITQCFHSFCATCTEELFNAEPRTADLTEAQQAKGMRQCPMCREPIERAKIFRASAFFNPEEQDKDEKPHVEILDGKAVLGKRSSQADAEDIKPALKKLQTDKGKGKAVEKDDKKEEKPVSVDIHSLDITPSTKMKRLCAIIEEKLAADPTCKVVAYSQFTSFLDLCGSYLRTTGTPNLQYQGSMHAKERQDVLDQFNKPTDQPGGESRVLLLSLKAGGVGLNLTISNVVVALDLAWNAATEDQAVDRCHRIGQTKEVDVRRLVVTNTIDARIKALQETKRSLADGALGEGEGGKLGRLSIGDLIRLFNVDGSGEDA